MRQVLGPGALGRPRGSGWRGRWEGGLGWGIHVNPWLIQVNVWQKPLQYCKVISLQLIKIKEKKKKKKKKKKEKPLILGRIEGGRRGQQRRDGWMASLTLGHEFEKTPGVGDGQGSLACCSPWGHKESDATERLN